VAPKAGEELGWRTFAWHHTAWWIFLLALTVRVALIFAIGSYQRPERTEVVKIAIKLAENGEFADAYGPGTGPTAHTSPLYPLLLSCVFRLFGTGQAGELGQEILSSLIGSLACALLPYLALAFHLGRTTGVWAGLCAALLPVNFWAETKGSFESALSELALVVICLYFALAWERERFSLREACAGGVMRGLRS
jgi:4-amino-4-deoxy-L-arabinose transferase-like glycosyltransferase